MLQSREDILTFILPFEGPDILLSLKEAGNMEYRENGITPERLNLYGLIGVDPERAVSCRQIHSRKIFMVDKAPEGVLQGDGLITGNKNLVLCATAADCMPVYFIDRNTGSFGITHSGWKGTGIAADAVRLFTQKMNSRIDDLVAVMGPSAGVCCYEVDEERYSFFKNNWGAESVDKRDGSFYLDLPAANRQILESTGVKNIYSFNECTICNDKYGSFRREGPGRFTLMLAMIGYFG